MGMGKNSRSPLAQMTAPIAYKEPDRPPEMTIKQADNGGYSVSLMGKGGYSDQKQHVYSSLQEVADCLEKHFGKADDKSEAGEKKGEA